MRSLHARADKQQVPDLSRRRGARRIVDVPTDVLARLECGDDETVNLMEWLAVDMTALARHVAAQTGGVRLRSALEAVASSMAHQGVTKRLAMAGGAIAGAVSDFSAPGFRVLAAHTSDIVRQWACYAVNAPNNACALAERLALTLPFAADANMTVREAAWMAFRPYITIRLREGVDLLEPVSRSSDARLRRFAIEVLRPRSVWSAHIEALKRDPGIAASMLENVRADDDPYVQRAVGNWLNDAAKSQPHWVVETCARWSSEGNASTLSIVRRGLRTLDRRAAFQTEGCGSALTSEKKGA